MTDQISLVIVVSLASLSLGFLFFLIAFSTNNWVGIDGGLYLSLWRECFIKFRENNEWNCRTWVAEPDFIRASQAFAVLALLCFLLTAAGIISYVLLPRSRYSKIIMMILSILTFSSGALTLMLIIVIGLKGRHYLYDIKDNTSLMFALYIDGIDTSGVYEVGWSFILAILSILLTFGGFGGCLIEYTKITEEEGF